MRPATTLTLALLLGGRSWWRESSRSSSRPVDRGVAVNLASFIEPHPDERRAPWSARRTHHLRRAARAGGRRPRWPRRPRRARRATGWRCCAATRATSWSATWPPSASVPWPCRSTRSTRRPRSSTSWPTVGRPPWSWTATAPSAWAGVDRGPVPSVRLVIAAGADIDGAERVARRGVCGRSRCPLVERAAADLAVLLFTSGTAGAPRAAMLTHGCLAANIAQAQAEPAAA